MSIRAAFIIMLCVVSGCLGLAWCYVRFVDWLQRSDGGES